jgi:phosphomannomutase / phosphoglucomutase
MNMIERFVPGLLAIWTMLGLLSLFGVQAQQGTQQIRPLLKAEDLARQVVNTLADTTKTLKILSRDEDLTKLLQTGDEAALAAKAEELTAGFKGALRLRLIRPGTANRDMSTQPPLGYASLDMLRRAETTKEPISAEFHSIGNGSQHIVMIQRIRDNAGQLVGLIHLALDPAILNAAVAGLGLTEVYVEITQPAPGEAPLRVATSGTPQGDIKPSQAPVPGTRWTVALYGGTPETQPVAPASQWGSSVPVVAGIMLAVVVVGGWLFIHRQRRLTTAEHKEIEKTEDTADYQGAVKAFMEGAHPELKHVIPELPEQASHSPPPESDIYEDTMPYTVPQLIDEAPESVKPVAISDSIFRAYDIRGVVGETLTEEVVYQIGRALGSEAHERDQQSLVIARDGRISSPALSSALQNGLRESGRDVIDIGVAPTPVLYFATHYLQTGSGIMVTGSHNPPNYNGLKIVLDDQALSGEAITAIRDRIRAGNFTQGTGGLLTTDILSDYIRRITEDIPAALSRSFKVVVDCGNGVPGAVAPQLLRALGHEVIELYCEVDGEFPNHHPDPSQPENLKDLIDRVKGQKADLGLAFDGDGDRLGVVDGMGTIIWPDRQMMLFAKDVLSRNPGQEIIFDVKCSSHLKHFIEAHGGKPTLWKTGHSLIKTKMKESGAPLAGEMSGHIFFKERWYGFDDALYAAARLLEILLKEKGTPTAVFAQLPSGIATPELRLAMPEQEHAPFMETLIKKASFEGAEIITVDGLRVDFPDRWGLIRPSNTSPYLILRFEADDQGALERIQEEFRRLLQAVGSGHLKLPF